MDPELIARMVQDLLAQSDQTRVADPRNRKEPEPQGDAKNFIFNLLQGGDPTFGLGSNLAGAIPERPDIKLQIAMGLLTGGSLKHLFKGAAKGAARLGRGARSLADEALDTLLERLARSGPARAGDEVLNRISRSLSPRGKTDLLNRPFSTKIMSESRTMRTLERLITPPGEMTTAQHLRAGEKAADDALLQEVIRDRARREGKPMGVALLDSEIAERARETARNEFIERFQDEASIEQLFQKFLDSEIIKGAGKPKG